MAREPIARNGLACLYGERTSLQAAEFHQRLFGRLDALKHGPRLREKGVTGLRQLDRASDAVEQLGIVARLQNRDGVAGRGLLRDLTLEQPW